MENYTINNYRIDSPVPFSFTIYKHRYNSDNNTVLYYLHGSGGDDRTFPASHSELLATWEKQKKPVPLVVGISLGERWVLVPRNKSKISGTLEYFLDTVMPQIEDKLHNKIKRRYILGISMGGYNVAQLVFRHPGLFQKAAVISPSIFPFSPYAGNETINEYCSKVRKNNTGLRLLINYYLLKKDTIRNNVNSIINGRRKEFIPDQTSWEEANIIDTMKKPPRTGTPLIYISCGNKDEYGFYYGSCKLAEKARSLSYPVKLRMLKGGHMVRDEKEIADFFIND